MVLIGSEDVNKVSSGSMHGQDSAHLAPATLLLSGWEKGTVPAAVKETGGQSLSPQLPPQRLPLPCSPISNENIKVH